MTIPAERIALARPSRIHHLVLASLLLITGINYMQRNCIGPLATTIKEDLEVSHAALDGAMAAFFLAYTLLQVPSGWLAQSWGSRLVLPLYAAGWSLALLLCIAPLGFAALYSGRLLMGALQAGIFPCCTLILAVWYPASQRGLATALLNSFMLIGSAAGSTLASYLLEPIGWRGVFLVYAVPGVLWAVWFLWWFRDRPADHPRVNEAERAQLPAPSPEGSKGPSLAQVPWLMILASVPLILLCTQQAFRAGANRLFDSRLPTYLELERGLTARDAGLLASCPQWAGVVGGIFGGAISDYVLRRTGRRRLARNGVAILSLLSCCTVYVLAYLIDNVYLAVVVLSLGAFLFTFSSPCAYALSIDIGGKYLPIVFGMMNMIGNFGAYLFVSSIMTMVGLGGWNLAFGVWLGMHLVAIVLWFFLNPNVTIGEPTPAET